MKVKKQTPFYLLLLIALVFQPAWTNSAPLRQDGVTGPIVSEAVTPLSSVKVSSLPLTGHNTSVQHKDRSPQNPLQNEPDQGKRGTWNRLNVPIDPLIQPKGSQDLAAQSAPALLLSFDGISNPTGCGTCVPPNPNGDVGPNYYVQMAGQTKVAIYSKTGTLLNTPFDLGTLWPSGNCTGNAGDPVVVYDSLADRWVLSQIADPHHMCFAVSKTADPTQSYWLYEFDVLAFPDYFKIGVWSDAYYMSAHEAVSYTAYAFDRANMLLGNTATFQKFSGGANFYLPGDLDGTTPPPVGTPNYFYTFKDSGFHGVSSDRIEVSAFHVDWTTPSNSTFNLQNSFDITPFTYTVCGYFNLNCISQQGTAQKLSAVSEWPMFRFPYRNFGASQSLVGTFTVGGGVSGEAGAAIRWFELRNTGTGWALYQEGTFDPGDGNDRFMPSIAIDRIGDIALGYSVSSTTIHPSIRYTMHRVGDALGVMEPEVAMIAGGGAQTGSNSWGSYSSMSVDPADDLTFWYTNEYYAADSPDQWKTLVGTFKNTVLSSSFTSTGLKDGWVLESGEKTNKGGTLNKTARILNLGDDVTRKQYRSILSFGTASLPDNAVVFKATLMVRKAGVAGGGDPVKKFKGFMVDVKKGSFGTSALAKGDFQAGAGHAAYGPFVIAPSGGWYGIDLTAGSAYINTLNLTQIRLRFKLDDNNNSIANFLKLYSGNAVAASRPKLLIEYYLP